MNDVPQPDRPIRIGISACLLGRKVRFDGGHKQDRFLTDTLGEYFEWVPVCPEVEVGLPTPRPSLRLQLDGDQIRMVMPKEYGELGRLVAAAKRIERKELRATYDSQFMAALSKIATRAKNTNVLQHILGFFKKELDAPSRQELLGHVQDYRQGLVPLVVPLTLVAHYVRILNVPYLRDQIYLNPHPKELALRNHV
jgi:uncharacterized protein YbgA (DUF1722 family)